jgi:hypothetical protein
MSRTNTKGRRQQQETTKKLQLKPPYFSRDRRQLWLAFAMVQIGPRDATIGCRDPLGRPNGKRKQR